MKKLPTWTLFGMLVVFCASFAFMWHQRDAEQQRAAALEAPSKDPVRAAPRSSIADDHAATNSPQIPAIVVARDTREPQGSASAPSPPSLAASQSAADQNAELQPLPVAFHIRKLPDLAKTEGDIRNGTSVPLAIMIREIDGKRQPVAQVQIELAPGQLKTFGIEDGLALHSGDQVILESRSYLDKIARVP